MPPVKKVYAYITCAEKLLVFSQADFTEAWIQVPGGTMEPDELPESAVLREAHEETGPEGLQLAANLGCDEINLLGSNPGEQHQRHFCLLLCPDDVPEKWQHYESHPIGRFSGVSL